MANKKLGLEHALYEARLEKTYRVNENAYWEGYIQFGADEALKPKWFYSVGFDQGYDYSKERTDEIMNRIKKALEAKSPEVFLEQVKTALSDYKQLYVREKNK